MRDAIRLSAEHPQQRGDDIGVELCPGVLGEL
ncbi:MAG: hypothetical protein QOK16_4197, partial [Solirubrobacteraceae bacterium]|nr:hypothetical protein [Solirubrobacteraceae bacterium]